MAQAIPVLVFGQIEMNVLFVIAIRAGAEHSDKTRAGARLKFVAHRFLHVGISQLVALAIRKSDRANVDGVGTAMLADLRTSDPVTRPAFL